jgi:peptide-methionine (S)-S-oxide reductase
MKSKFPIAAFVAALAGCGSDYQPEVPKAAVQRSAAAGAATETAIVAGGCFWCTEADFEKVPGVKSAISGYIGGSTPSPTYEQVSAGGTGHYEAVSISYDPQRVSYAQLIDYYFRTVDPLDGEGQFCDKGESYRTAIFPLDAEQGKIAEREKSKAAKALSAEIATRIVPASTFYPAEDYHQDYHKKNKLKYNFYRSRCGRDARLAELWGGKA